MQKSHSYYFKKLNEGFDILGHRKLHYTDAHQKILNTSFDGEPTLTKMFIRELGYDIDVYSIFKRQIQHSTKGDSNPVLYALKKEHGWSFANKDDRNLFWRRFRQLLKRFLKKHQDEYDTVIVIPSSNRLNKDIVEEIAAIAKEVGIKHISSGGLYTVSTDVVDNSIFAKDSYFKKYWGDDFEYAYDKLQGYLDIMDEENDGKFKYHLIDDFDIRRSILYTLSVDKKEAFLYSEHINDCDILIVDDSITYGQSIENAIHAINEAYTPHSVSVLTMFSRLCDEDGNEIEK